MLETWFLFVSECKTTVGEFRFGATLPQRPNGRNFTSRPTQNQATELNQNPAWGATATVSMQSITRPRIRLLSVSFFVSATMS